MPADLELIARLLKEALDIKDKISEEIRKEEDAKKRKKLQEACDSGNTAVIRQLWWDDV